MIDFDLRPELAEVEAGFLLEDAAQVLRAEAHRAGDVRQARLLVPMAADQLQRPLDLAVRRAVVHGAVDASPLQNVADDFRRLLDAAGLLKVVVRPTLEGFDGDLFRAVSRQDDDADVGVDLPYLLEDFRSPHARHHLVQKHRVDVVGTPQDPQSLLPAGGLLNGVFLQAFPEFIEEVRIVVDQQ